MNSIIIYASKYGCTEACVKQLKALLEGDITLCEINNEKNYDLSLYDEVIIGGSVYIGRINKKLKKFCLKNLNLLVNKKVGLFITCLKEDAEAFQQIITNYPQELIDIAITKDYFGGEIINSKLGFFDRLITNMVSKSPELSFPKPDENNNVILVKPDHIERFSKIMNDN